VGYYKIRRTVRKRREGVWYPLRLRLGFKHAAEHSQGLNIPELAIMSQPEKNRERKQNKSRGGMEEGQQLRSLPWGRVEETPSCLKPCQ
jgi:hypothetical protein